ncbi:DMT family transporter [Pseudomonas marincola]|uniref:DMT family transporter n=1 Tax=Pseudomonas marincola TaxID=437900 RepID=UPI0008EA91B5|nr:DMT family transporter [Pseudomonas marincola]SFT61792.1 EamA-like transporter family protein [Pseudomonas marincola]
MNGTKFLRAHCCMIVWAVLIATSFFAAAEVSPAVDPVFLTILRLALSASLFLPIVLARRELPNGLAGLSRHALLGMLLAIYFASLFEALRYTSAVTTALMYALVPLGTLCFELIFVRRSSIFQAAPMVIAALGAIIIIDNGTDTKSPVYPLIVFGIGCIAMAAYSPLSQRFKGFSLKGCSPSAMTFWNMAFGAGFLGCYSFFTGGWRSAASLQWSDIGWIAYLAVFATLGTFYLLHRSIGILTPTMVTSYIYLSTVMSTAAHWYWMRQYPSIADLFGMAMVIAAMAVLISMSQRAAPAIVR